MEILSPMMVVPRLARSKHSFQDVEMVSLPALNNVMIRMQFLLMVARTVRSIMVINAARALQNAVKPVKTST